MAIIARYAPGLGDPMSMTLPELEAWSEAVGYVIRRENGTQRDEDTHRARVEADMKRLHG